MASANFGPGPWNDEPDHGTFEADGFGCTIKRHSTLGHLCGYVDVPKGHSWWGKHYDDIEDAEVHGGLTYSEVTPSGAYRLGFDCAHSGDLSPGFKWRGSHRFHQTGDVYRAWSYVETEVRNLARQALEAATP
jgi:hypothetical protein